MLHLSLYKLFCNIIKDCTEMKIVTKRYADENTWTFGACSSSQSYEDDQTYTEHCCQPPGVYTLDCIDSFGDGWHKGYIQVGGKGKKYCKKFKKGFNQSHEITIEGM